MRALLLAFLAASSTALAQGLPYVAENTVRSSDFATTQALSLYVETTGNDSNDCQSTTSACLTLTGACNRVPMYVKHPVTITFGSGNFTGGICAGKFIIPSTTGSANYLHITGTWSTPTLASGSASGTLTGFTAASGATFAVFTDTSASWTTNDLVGKFIEITAGTGFTTSSIYLIQANTATTITALNFATQTAAAGATYAIRDTGTVINTAVSAETGAPFGSSPNSSTLLRFDQILSSGTSSNAPVILSKMRTTGNSITHLFVGGATRIQARYLKMDGTVHFGITAQHSNVLVNNVYCTNTGAGVCLAGTGVDYSANGLRVQSSYFSGGNSGINMATGGSVVSSYFTGHSVGSIALGGQGGATILQLQNSRFNGGAKGIQVSNGSSGGGVAQIGANNVDISNCTSIGVDFASPGAFGEFQNTSGSGNAVGWSVKEGSKLNLTSTVTMTGTVEIQMDTATTTLATMRAASPRLVTNTYGSLVYE